MALLDLPQADVVATGLRKHYGAGIAVDDVSFRVERGHVLSLLGPSGCGKTTIMRMIAGLVTPTAGHIAIGGRDVTATPVHRRNIGMLFQNYALFPHLTVAQNLAFGLEMRKVPKVEIASRVDATLELVRLSAMRDRLPHALSGGQQQRVGLARALIIEPSILLLDEPFGALDKKLRESMQIEMRQLQQRLGITTIMVTHDQDEALTLSDHIAVMNAGRIEQIGTPRDIYERPATRFVAGFIGSSNFIEGAVGGQGPAGYTVTREDGLVVTLDGSAPVGARATVALRPECIRLEPALAGSDGPNAAHMVVEQIVYLGSNTHIHLRRPGGGGSLLAVTPNDTDGSSGRFAPGSEVFARWDASQNRLVAEAA